MVARKPAPEGAPTVLLYAHHDVQPVGDPADWDSDAVRADRARRAGSTAAAPPTTRPASPRTSPRSGRTATTCRSGVTVFVEGEEEVGSPTLEAFLAEHRTLLAADVIVIADSGNWDIGVPALTTSLRGLVDCFVEVRTLDHAVHSGMWGGVVPDAVTALVRLLATLHDDEGNVAVAGPARGPGRRRGLPARTGSGRSPGSADGVELIGSGSVVERLWTKPAIAIIGFDATRTADASNTLIPSVKAQDLACGSRPATARQAAMERLREHLEKHVPWGARLDLHRRRARRADRDRRDRPGVRRGAGRLPRGLGRRRAGRHGRRRLDPVHRGVPARRSPTPPCS